MRKLERRERERRKVKRREEAEKMKKGKKEEREKQCQYPVADRTGVMETDRSGFSSWL